MDITNIGKFGKWEKNAILRTARLVMEMESSDESYDVSINGETGIVFVQKWKRDGGELEIVAQYMWKPGINQSANGYTSLKDIQVWLESERDVHTEANLALCGKGREG